MYERVIIFGAGGWLARSIATRLLGTVEVVLISRGAVPIDGGARQYVVSEYSREEIMRVFGELSPCNKTTIIFFNGLTDSTVFYSISPSEISDITNSNFLTPLRCTHAALTVSFSGELRFIYLSSSRAELGDPGLVMYSATKAAIKAAVKSLSLEYSRLGRYFFVLSLGLTNGGLLSKIPENKSRELLRRSAIREFVSLDAILDGINFLRCNKAMSGSVLYCDNGYH